MKCKNCGLDYEGNFCPRCGAPSTFTPPPPQQENTRYQTPQLQCPKCGSRNITFHREETGNIGVHQNTVVIQQPKKSHGCLYWLFIGWWYKPMEWICFGWMKPLFGGRKRGGLNLHAGKTLNLTIAICQNCGNSWKI